MAVKAIRTKLIEVKNQSIAIFNGYAERVTELKKELKIITEECSTIEKDILKRYPNPGTYRDKVTGEMIQIGIKVSTSSSYKQILDELKAYISTELNASDKIKSDLLSEVDSLTEEFAGKKIENRAVWPYREDD